MLLLLGCMLASASAHCMDKDKETFPFGHVMPEVVPYGIPQIQADSLKLPRNIEESGVMICVIDSGIDSSQGDLALDRLDGCT